MTKQMHRLLSTTLCLGANHPKRGADRRANIMARREQTHADHAGQTQRSLMRRFKGALRLPTAGTTQRTNAESKRLGLPHQGTREMARRAHRFPGAGTEC